MADYKKNGGITSANPAWDMFSAYNGMAAGFFNGDWGVLLTALASNNKNDRILTVSTKRKNSSWKRMDVKCLIFVDWVIRILIVCH